MLSLFAIYSLCHGWSLVHPGIYWDDWVLIGIDPELVRDDFFRNGRPFFGLLHEALLHLPFTIFVYKILIFTGYFIASIQFYKILQKIKYFTEKDALLLCLLFTVLPYNAAQYSIVIIQYVVCLVLFFTALLLWLKNEPKPYHRVIMFICFVLSMYIEAFLFLLVFLILLFEFFKIKTVKKNFEIIGAVILFIFLRYVVHPPQDIYASLNSIQLNRLLLSPLYLIQSFKLNFVAVFSESLSKIIRYSTVISALFSLPFIWFIITNYSHIKDIKTDKSILYKTLLGFALFFCAVFPFIVVGKLPSNLDWQTRSQFLLPIGASLLIYFGIYLIFKNYIQRWVLFFIIYISVHLNVIYGFEYFFDYLKQESLILQFQKNELIKNSSTFVVDDLSENLNARSRTYRLYEYTGLFKVAFNDEKRLAYRIKEVPSQKDIEFGYMKEFNNLKDYIWSEPTLKIKILKGETNPRALEDGLQLIWSYFLHSLNLLDANSYNEELLKIVKLEVIPFDASKKEAQLEEPTDDKKRKYLFELY